MKSVTVRELQKKVKECVDSAQEDRVIVTRHGAPAAILVGVEGGDWESVVLQTDPTFWKLIRSRRRQPTVTLSQLKSRLRIGAAVSRRRRASPKATKPTSRRS